MRQLVNEDDTDFQSWWEIPAIAHFCHIYKSVMKFSSFEIEELEEALLLSNVPETKNLVTELIRRLMKNACKYISDENWEQKLYQLWFRKHNENLDGTFCSLPLRTKVRILYGLCEVRLDAADVYDIMRKLPQDEMRATCLGEDSAKNIYWYFYGQRLYKETHGEFSKKKKEKPTWKVACSTVQDWTELSEQFGKGKRQNDLKLKKIIDLDYLPQMIALAAQKELLLKKKLLEMAPRRASSRLQLKKQRYEELHPPEPVETEEDKKKRVAQERHKRAMSRLRTNEVLEREESESYDSHLQVISEEIVTEDIIVDDIPYDQEQVCETVNNMMEEDSENEEVEVNDSSNESYSTEEREENFNTEVVVKEEMDDGDDDYDTEVDEMDDGDEDFVVNNHHTNSQKSRTLPPTNGNNGKVVIVKVRSDSNNHWSSTLVGHSSDLRLIKSPQTYCRPTTNGDSLL